jgi:hypothetical protein
MSRWARIAILLLFASLCAAGIFRHRGPSPFSGGPKPARLFAAIQERVSAAQSQDFVAPILPASNPDNAGEESPGAEISPRESHEARTAIRFEFGKTAEEGDRAAVQVFFVARDKRVTPAVYHLAREGGLWRVEAVRFKDRWPAGDRLGGLEL